MALDIFHCNTNFKQSKTNKNRILIYTYSLKSFYIKQMKVVNNKNFGTNSL